MMGMKAIEAAKVFVEETGISDSLSAEQFLAEREAKLQSLFPTSDLMPGKWNYILLPPSLNITPFAFFAFLNKCCWCS